MILMIDNYDSFTYNIVQYCLELGANLKIIRNNELNVKEIEELNPDKIIISPGPGTPDDSGVCLETIRHFADKKPILGICLGHQCIAQAFGGEIIKAKKLMHGKTSQIKQNRESLLFYGLPEKFTMTRYHSLVVNKTNLPNSLIPIAYSMDDDEIMAIQIQNRPIFGVQFHPESILSEYGHDILRNFLNQ